MAKKNNYRSRTSRGRYNYNQPAPKRRRRRSPAKKGISWPSILGGAAVGYVLNFMGVFDGIFGGNDAPTPNDKPKPPMA